MNIECANKTQIKSLYNIIKVVSAKELSVLAKTYKDNNDTIIVMMKRKPNKPDVLQQILDRLTKIEQNQTKDHNLLIKDHNLLIKDHDLLINVIKFNNLKTK